MTQTERNPLDLMVLDPNILDLTTVLYHYDKDLSLYEGEYVNRGQSLKTQIT
ncbi:MAG: hypothetical protein ACQEQ7_05520 [Thermodesulfobacteriota bacterium]